MTAKLRWIWAGSLVAITIAVPFIYYRASYAHSKRLREVVPGKVFRSGELTAAGFREAIVNLKIRTVLNLQDEYPDPLLPQGYFDPRVIHESALCRELGVRYAYIAPDLLPRNRAKSERPAAIEEFLKLMDDPASYPVLIHCKAGLHRTGVMACVYRMEYCGYSPRQAFEELRSNGFGDYPCTSANDYIQQYVLSYKPGQRRSSSMAARQP